MRQQPTPHPLADLQARFLQLLPKVETHGRIFFRNLRCPHRRDDAVAEMIALSWLWFLRLARRGRDAGEFVGMLARFAGRAVKSGRRLAGGRIY